MPVRTFSAKIEIYAKSSASVIYSALKPDIVSSPERRISTHIRLVKETIMIDINSSDLRHLRASLNSDLRLARAAFGCLEATTL
ncbi:MAG: KEOPS complex subunit Pcc1 [Nitrososphaerales archaeon]